MICCFLPFSCRRSPNPGKFMSLVIASRREVCGGTGRGGARHGAGVGLGQRRRDRPYAEPFPRPPQEGEGGRSRPIPPVSGSQLVCPGDRGSPGERKSDGGVRRGPGARPTVVLA